MKCITCVIVREVWSGKRALLWHQRTLELYFFQHYIFPAGGDGLFLMVDEKGKFREDSFQKALNALVPTSESGRKKVMVNHKRDW